MFGVNAKMAEHSRTMGHMVRLLPLSVPLCVGCVVGGSRAGGLVRCGVSVGVVSLGIWFCPRLLLLLWVAFSTCGSVVERCGLGVRSWPFAGCWCVVTWGPLARPLLVAFFFVSKSAHCLWQDCLLFPASRPLVCGNTVPFCSNSTSCLRQVGAIAPL